MHTVDVYVHMFVLTFAYTYVRTCFVVDCNQVKSRLYRAMRATHALKSARQEHYAK